MAQGAEGAAYQRPASRSQRHRASVLGNDVLSTRGAPGVVLPQAMLPTHTFHTGVDDSLCLSGGLNLISESATRSGVHDPAGVCPGRLHRQTQDVDPAIHKRDGERTLSTERTRGRMASDTRGRSRCESEDPLCAASRDRLSGGGPPGCHFIPLRVCLRARETGNTWTQSCFATSRAGELSYLCSRRRPSYFGTGHLADGIPAG